MCQYVVFALCGLFNTNIRHNGRLRTGRKRQNNPVQAHLSGQKTSLNRKGLFSEAWTISADHQVLVKRPPPSVQTLSVFLPCLHLSAAHMATAQHCAGRHVGRCGDLIGCRGEGPSAPQPQEVHCNPTGTQSSAVKAAVQSRGSSDIIRINKHSRN